MNLYRVEINKKGGIYREYFVISDSDNDAIKKALSVKFNYSIYYINVEKLCSEKDIIK